MVAHLSRKVVVLGLFLAAAAMPARAAEIGKYLPNDTEFVVTVNLKQIIDSPLVQKHGLEMAKAALQGNDEARKVFEALGLDPFKDIATITVAGPDQSAKAEQATIILQGRFDSQKIAATAAEVAKKEADKLTIHKIGDETIYELKNKEDKKSAYAVLLDGGTILAASAKDYVAEALDKRAGKKQTKVKQELQDLLTKADANQSVSIVVLASAVNAMDAVKGNDKSGLVGKVLNLTGGITISNEIKVDFQIETKDKAAATEIKNSITTGLGVVTAIVGMDPNLAPVADVLTAVKVMPQGTSVQIKVLVSKEVIEKAIKGGG